MREQAGFFRRGLAMERREIVRRAIEFETPPRLPFFLGSAWREKLSAVIEEDTAATSSELNWAIENIASVSEKNSAAVEEVSASTEDVSA